MSVVVPNEGEIGILLVLGTGGLTLFLFKNDVTPNDSTVLADLTPANFSGASDTDGAYEISEFGTDGSGRGYCTTGQYVWTHNGGGTNNTIYGWCIKINDLSKIWKCGRFATPIVMDTGGKTIKITDTSLAQGTIT